jgi:sugar lactone lactonase YvrE
MANTKDFKVKNGVEAATYYENVGTVSDLGDGSTAIEPSQSKLVDTGYSEGLFIDSSGTRLFALNNGNDTVRQYTLSTAWDISTATYDTKSYTPSEDTLVVDIDFKSDGTKMYVLGRSSDTVYQYSLSTAWDVSTASYDSVSFSVNTEESLPYGMTFKPDGTKMYITGRNGDDVNQYDLSTAWVVSSATAIAAFSISSQQLNVNGLTFTSDGLTMYVTGSASGLVVDKYTLGTAWTISTASHTTTYGPYSGSGGFGEAILVGDSDTKLYVGGVSIILQFDIFGSSYQVDMSTGNAYNITLDRDLEFSFTNPAASGLTSTATLVIGVGYQNVGGSTYDTQLLALNGQDTIPRQVFFKPDGTRFYMVGDTNNTIYQYSMSTAFDLSTAAYDTVSFSVATEETAPQGMFIGDSGTKMYVVGSAADTVFQYTLSTAWDLSTASYASKSFVATGFAAPNDVIFDPTGTRMGIVNSGTLLYHTLSTAWDVSTASYDSASHSFNIGSTNTSVSFSEDGTKIYSTDNSTDLVVEYPLSTAFDITTIGDATNALAPSVGSGAVSISVLHSGKKLYILDVGTDDLYQYTLPDYSVVWPSAIDWAGGTAPDISTTTLDTHVVTITTDDGGTTYRGVHTIDGAS